MLKNPDPMLASKMRNNVWMNLPKWIFLVMSFIVLVYQQSSAQKKEDKKKSKVFVMDIRETIDPRMSRYVELALEDATSKEADIIIIDMDTYGGALNDADNITTTILGYPKPVWVFINKDAASAGALISIACDSIYMAPGATIGAATVVTGDGTAAPDKYQAYMRGMMRSTAEANNRNPKIAEAMVDEDLVVDSISQAGQVITFTTAEALKYGYCEAKVNSIAEILKRNNINDYQLIEYELSTVEKFISIFLNPFISGILILIIIGGLYFELQTPGIGFPLAASIVAALLYFIPYYLNGLAANWEILVFMIGLGLIAVEVFVIPGFGVAGISGIILSFGALVLMMLGNNNFDFSWVPQQAFFEAITAVSVGLFGGLLVIVFGGYRLTNSRYMKKVSLEHTMDRSMGYTSNFNAIPMVGKVGYAYTVLRPGGKVMIEDVLFDASTRGDYIEKGEWIVVVSEEGSSLRVKKLEDVKLYDVPASNVS